MQLYSMAFLLFALILLLLYYTGCRRCQWQCLLVGSLFFYACFGVSHLIYLLVTSLSVWGCAMGFGRIRKKRGEELRAEGLSREEKKAIRKKWNRPKRALFLAALVLNLGILAYFKYWNSFLEEIAGLLRINVKSFSLYHAGGLLLPLGISFYTFIALGYLIDTYNEKYAPEGNYFRFLLFVSWFPQLIQGPINRYDAMKDQFLARHRVDMEQWKRAGLLLLFGAMKKYAIADLLSGAVAALFDHKVDNLSGPVIVTGILMYAVQQYCDFSGGIDMVCGISGLFGISMAPNFRQPYFATSLADFWRRWHISLGAWMRDYVFYPFALTRPMQRFGRWCQKRFGRQAGRVLPAALSNLLVFYLVGLWHGSEGHYIAWGLYNGIVIALSDLLLPVYERLNALPGVNTRSRGFHIFRIVRTFLVVCIGWYFDRIPTVSAAFKCLHHTLFHPDWNLSMVHALFGEQFSGVGAVLPVLCLIALIIVFVSSLLKERGVDGYVWLQERALAARWAILLCMLLLILASFAYSNGGGGFLYANF